MKRPKPVSKCSNRTVLRRIRALRNEIEDRTGDVVYLTNLISQKEASTRGYGEQIRRMAAENNRLSRENNEMRLKIKSLDVEAIVSLAVLTTSPSERFSDGAMRSYLESLTTQKIVRTHARVSDCAGAIGGGDVPTPHRRKGDPV